jgi:hypothetical protein
MPASAAARRCVAHGARWCGRRRWLAGLLSGAPERDDVVVVAVELVTNAIRHIASGPAHSGA